LVLRKHRAGRPPADLRSDADDPRLGIGPAAAPGGERLPRPVVSDELETWLRGDGDKSLGSLIEVFGKRSFAIVFVLLMGPSALPLPTGGVTHVFEIITILLALQLIAGREEVWLPARWRQRTVNSEGRFINALLRSIRWLERFSRPRLMWVFGHRATNVVFGLLVIAGTLGAIAAPPFSGLDTLPSLGVVLISLGVLLEDFLLVVAGVVAGAVGVALEIVAGGAALRGLKDLF
jgi:hypothetical protein